VTRREFIALLGSLGDYLELPAIAQQLQRMRWIGVLMLYPENDPEGQLPTAGFGQGLQTAGWTIGRNVQIE
jgi:hypothetical protein